MTEVQAITWARFQHLSKTIHSRSSLLKQGITICKRPGSFAVLGPCKRVFPLSPCHQRQLQPAPQASQCSSWKGTGYLCQGTCAAAFVFLPQPGHDHTPQKLSCARVDVSSTGAAVWDNHPEGTTHIFALCHLDPLLQPPPCTEPSRAQKTERPLSNPYKPEAKPIS